MRARSHGKVRRKNSYFPSCLPMRPRAPQPSRQSSQKHINSDWVRAWFWDIWTLEDSFRGKARLWNNSKWGICFPDNKNLRLLLIFEGTWGFSFKLRGLENTILARILFWFQERTWERPLKPFWIPLCVSVSLYKYHITWNQNIYENFLMASPCRSLCSYLLTVGDVRGYCVLSNHCHIQILDVSHDLLNGFVSGLPFSSPPPPPPPPSKISSPLAP